MNETVFENMAEDLKNDIARDIAYTYSVFVPADTENTVFKMKSNILLPDRKYIGKLLKGEDKEGLIFPCNVLEESIERHIEDFYNEFELNLKTRWQLSQYGDRTNVFKKHFKENMEKSKDTTLNTLRRELNSQIMLQNDVKTVIGRIDFVLSGRIGALKSFLEDSAGQLEQYMLLWDYEDRGFTTYRNKVQGDTCEDCVKLDKKSFPIKEAELEVNLAPLHINCDCEIEILDDAGNVVFTIERELKERKKNGLDYLETSVNQIIKGNYTDDVNLVGTLGQIAAGFFGVDVWADIRDIVYDVSEFKVTSGHIFQTIIDLVSLAPFIGSIKYADETWEGLKAGVKNVDEAIDAMKEANRSAKGTELLNRVTNIKLKNAIKEMYRPGAKLGDGGLADAIRHEIRTGQLVGGKSHIQKGKEHLKNLERILEKETLNKHEKDIIQELIKDLRQALGGK